MCQAAFHNRRQIRALQENVGSSEGEATELMNLEVLVWAVVAFPVASSILCGLYFVCKGRAN